MFKLPFSSGLLPLEVAGGAVAGLNGRFRLYKYDVNDVFKPHTDGSWPGTAVVNGEGSSQAQMLHRFIAWFVFFVFFSPFCGEGGGGKGLVHQRSLRPPRVSSRESGVITFASSGASIKPTRCILVCLVADCLPIAAF